MQSILSIYIILLEGHVENCELQEHSVSHLICSFAEKQEQVRLDVMS